MKGCTYIQYMYVDLDILKKIFFVFFKFKI